MRTVKNEDSGSQVSAIMNRILESNNSRDRKMHHTPHNLPKIQENLGQGEEDIDGSFTRGSQGEEGSLDESTLDIEQNFF